MFPAYRRPIYAVDAVNHCPSCGQSQWFVGRIVAECACCGDTLSINHAVRGAARGFRPALAA